MRLNDADDTEAADVAGPSRVRACVAVTPTDHAVDRAEQHGALGGRGALAQVLQHQRAVAEDVDELAEVEDADLLQVLPLLVGRGRTDGRQRRRVSER